MLARRPNIVAAHWAGAVWFTVAAALFGCRALRAADATPGAPLPNFLILVADDVGWRDFGCYGNDAIRTPNIDALARGGLLCRNAFLTTPSCSPSRISVLTGKYPHATGAEDLHTPLPAGEEFVSTCLQRRGYFTGHMLKTHYGPNGAQQFQWYGRSVEEFPAFVDAAEGRPFFLWVGFRDAHRPYQSDAIPRPHDPATVEVPPYLVDTPETRHDLALYYDELSRMDDHIGEIVAELRRRGVFDDTLVVFFSDNGMPFPRAKGTVYDSGIGTPLIFSWPARIEPNSAHEGLVSTLDLAPTLLELAGVEPPAAMQGSSMAAVLEDPGQPGRIHVFSERNWHNCDEHIRAVRTRRYKLVRNAYLELPLGNPSDVSRSPSWKSLVQRRREGNLTTAQQMLFRAPRPRLELYDLEADPYETRNLAGESQLAPVVAELETVLDRWIEETGDFPPSRRRRGDNTDRVTGVKFTNEIPPLEDEAPR